MAAAPGQMSYQDYLTAAQVRDREDLVGSSVHDVLWNAFHESRVLHNGEQCHDLGTFFLALDKDSNGRVSAQELRDAVEGMDIVLTDSQINHLVGLMDIIKDKFDTPAGGVVDEWEFKQFMLGKDGRDGRFD